MDLSAWWEALSALETFYWIVALPSTLIFLIQLVMLLVGGDHDADDIDIDHDGDFDGDHGAGFDVFSVKSVVSFLMFFGWAGLAAMQKGVIVWWGIVGISSGAGLIMMFLTAWIFFLLLKLQSSGTMEITNAIGQSGEVYLTIPAKKNGRGKVQLVIQGALRTIDAVTEDTEDIKTGSLVEVVEIENEILVVKRKR